MKPRSIDQWLLDKERHAAPDVRRRKAGIPAPLRAMTWDDMQDDAVVSVDEKTELSAKDVLQYQAELWPEWDGRGLVMLGPPGYGKTLGAALVAMHVIDAGGWVRFTSYADLVHRETRLFQLAREAERRNDWGEHEEEELKLRWLREDCDLLVLDDVGKERRSASDLAGDLLERIVRKRVNDGKATVITSNLSLEQWSAYNPSMESFLFQLGAVLEYTGGGDHRPDAQDEWVERVKRRGRR